MEKDIISRLEEENKMKKDIINQLKKAYIAVYDADNANESRRDPSIWLRHELFIVEEAIKAILNSKEKF